MDTLPSVIDIGLSSPTGIFFGHGARFPLKYQTALYLLDWSYGRIIAVPMECRGDSQYVASQEDFVTGRPLNVTDGCIGPDGALWFITGGRGTQSGLYRVSHKDESLSARTSASIWHRKLTDGEVIEARILNHSKKDGWSEDMSFTLQHGESVLPKLRLAARLDLEKTPPEIWRSRALAGGGLNALLALARVGGRADLHAILEAVMKSAPKPTLDALRVVAVAIARQGEPEEPMKQKLAAWASAYPVADILLNRELCRLLVYLKSPGVIEKTMPLLQSATTSEDLLFYPFMLRYLKKGWTLEQHRTVFEALSKAEKMNGASTFFKAINDTRSELAAALRPDEAAALAPVIHPPRPAALSAHALPGHSFKNWRLEDLEPQLARMDAKTRNRDSGRDALIRAQCVFCHRVSHDPALPAGVVGPDLVQVSARFNRRDLLDHILNPSKFIDEKFRFVTVRTTDGKTLTGSLESEDDERVVLKPNALAPKTHEIGKAMIQERHVSEISPMPAGLLNTLKAEQILDLLAWFEMMR